MPGQYGTSTTTGSGMGEETPLSLNAPSLMPRRFVDSRSLAQSSNRTMQCFSTQAAEPTPAEVTLGSPPPRTPLLGTQYPEDRRRREVRLPAQEACAGVSSAGAAHCSAATLQHCQSTGCEAGSTSVQFSGRLKAGAPKAR